MWSGNPSGSALRARLKPSARGNPESAFDLHGDAKRRLPLPSQKQGCIRGADIDDGHEFGGPEVVKGALNLCHTELLHPVTFPGQQNVSPCRMT